MTVNLIELLDHYGITGISIDSRTIKKGDAFFVLGNQCTHIKQKFIEQAIKCGAKLIITETVPADTSVPIYLTENVRDRLVEVIPQFYPALPEYLVGITGTNGKTSITNYFQQILALSGINSASVGTLGVITNISDLNTSFKSQAANLLTTRDIMDLRIILHRLKSGGISDVALEVSSHGIAQKRIAGLKFNSLVFTNLGHDHIDYHGDRHNYLLTKLKLFTEDYLANQGLIIINQNIPEANFILNSLPAGVDIIGIIEKIKSDSDKVKHQILWRIMQRTNIEQSVEFTYQGIIYHFTLRMLGKFQAFNVIIAAILAMHRGLPWSKIVDAIPSLKAVKGRMELITTESTPWQIFIDFAHTPDSLKLVIQELRYLTDISKGRLVIILGCGGNRDASKRVVMGKIASQGADLLIVTDDNPRHEDPAEIRKAIIIGTKSNAIEIAGRAKAIEYAISILQPGDILLIAGKGHESYQIIGDEYIPFEDAQVVRQILA